ncbi:MAG: glycosyltransferase family 4 protein [Verrucomicrobiota bacterium]
MSSKDKNPIRVALVVDLFPPIVGGAETHARDIALEMGRIGAEVTVLTRRAREDLAAEERLENGVTVLRVGAPGSPRWGKYRFIPALLREWKKRRSDFDLVYLCGFRVLGWPLARAAARTKTPLVLRAESCGEMSGGFIWDRPGGGTNRWLKALFTPLIRIRNRRLIRSGHFLAISSVIEEEYLEEGVSTDQLARIPNGVDLERFCPATSDEKEKLRLALDLPEGLVFLYSGKLNRGKGLSLLLSSWKEFKNGGGVGTLVLVGSGGGQFLSEEESLRETVVSEGLSHSVRFTGYKRNVEEWLKAADVFVFPSEMESFGLAPLEANACGLPAISTDAGALAETVPDGIAGIRIGSKDKRALTAALKRLSEDSALREDLGKSARKWVEENYSFSNIAKAHLELFRRLREGMT